MNMLQTAMVYLGLFSGLGLLASGLIMTRKRAPVLEPTGRNISLLGMVLVIATVLYLCWKQFPDTIFYIFGIGCVFIMLGILSINEHHIRFEKRTTLLFAIGLLLMLIATIWLGISRGYGFAVLSWLALLTFLAVVFSFLMYRQSD